jgi:hypothetical protein
MKRWYITMVVTIAVWLLKSVGIEVAGWEKVDG